MHRLALIVLFLFLAGISSCAPKKISPGLDQESSLFEIDQALKAEFEAVLNESATDLSIEVILLLAPHIDTRLYRNTKNIANPGGLNSTLHEFFLLVDNLFPNNMGSVLSRYEHIVASANCITLDYVDSLGCNLLINAKQNLNAPKRHPNLFRRDWPEWRVVGAVPENWAEDQTLWSYLNINNDRIDAKMDYLYVKLLRPWYSEGFINSDGWYISDRCKGFISDGNPENDKENKEFLSRMPLGFVLAKNLVVSDKNRKVWDRRAPHIIAWIYKPLTLSPKYPDPCKQKCPSHEEFKQYCKGGQEG
jgi:hypothetical protein